MARYISLFIIVLLLSPLTAFSHESLVLKNTTSGKCYTAKIGKEGKFSINGVKPGSYNLMLVASKKYLDTKINANIMVQDVRWVAKDDDIQSTENASINPSITISSDMISNASFYEGKEEHKKFAVILYSNLQTSNKANLTGSISNFSK